MSDQLSTIRQDRPNIYFTVAKGWLVKRVSSPTASSVARKLAMGNNIGKEVHEEFSNQLEGTICAIKTKEAEGNFAAKLEFHLLHSSGSVAIVQINKYSGYACKLLNSVLNLDVKKPILFETWVFNSDTSEDGKGYTVTIKQSGSKIEGLYGKDHADVPKWNKVKVQGKDVWDQTEQVDFFMKMVKVKVIPSIPTASSYAPAPVVEMNDEDAGEMNIPEENSRPEMESPADASLRVFNANKAEAAAKEAAKAAKMVDAAISPKSDNTVKF